MFEERVPASAAPATPPPEQPAAAVWGEIYTMPQGGRAPGATPAPPAAAKFSGSRRWLTVAVVAVVLAIGGVGIYLLFFRSAPPPAATTPPPAPVVPPTPVTPTPPPSPAIPLATAAERDSRRYLDVRNIQGGLELYFAAAKHYPVAALPLALGQDTTKVVSEGGFTATPQGATYLAEVPANPAPGGRDYLYESLDGTSYTITFQLEEGAAGYAAGEHKASPQGIDGLASSPPANATPRMLQLPVASSDGDGDGLTDAEEPLFGTDLAKADTDADTYADGLEVEQGYDPAKVAPALLQDSVSFASYQSVRFGYNLRYPTAWLAKAHDAEGSEVIFSGAGAEFIEVLVTDNPQHLTAQEWYAKQVPGTPVAPADVPTLQAGAVTWALSFDGLNAYLATDRYLVTVSYNIGPATQASYYQLFKAMVRMFNPGASAVASNSSDCGLAGSVHASTPSPDYSATDETKQAWGCFVDHFSTCTAATVSAVMDDSHPDKPLTFTVVGPQGSACVVSGPRVNLQTGAMTSGTCAASSRWLDAYFIESQKNNSTLSEAYLKGYLLANVVTLGSSSFTVSNPDGTTEQVSCH